MIKLLLILLFSTSLSAADFLYQKSDLFFFDDGEKFLMCKPAKEGYLTKCLTQDKKTRFEAMYNCTVAFKEDGYLKNCNPTGDI
jgi:hypothetical protein